MPTESMLELRRRPSASSGDALHALSTSHTDVDFEWAVDFVHAPRFATKSLCVFDSVLAARLAAGLMATRLWFECEQLDREKWHFAIAPAGHARLLALHDALLGAQKSSGHRTLTSPWLPEANGRIHS
ncbi:MAG: hypothetical protein ABIW82_04250 [Dokdonella sp.]